MDNDLAIIISKISKRYRIGYKEELNDSLIGSIASIVKSPIANFKKLKELSKFDDEESKGILWALKDISFQVPKGEVIGIIGHNGAGKSTLLKIISRITVPTSGSIEINGRVASLLEVGTGFHPELTGKENVFLNGAILGMSRQEIKDKYENILEFSGVEKFIHTPVKRYSTGMRVRLAFSVAAFLDPEILLIDEVLAVGDQEFQDKCLNRMESISKSAGRTIFFVSHNLQAVENLCDRVILLSRGKVIADGKPHLIIQKYLEFSLNSLKQDPNYFVNLKREGDGIVTFKNIKTIDKNSLEQFTVMQGDPLIFYIEIEHTKLVETLFSLTFKLSDSVVISRSKQISLDNVKVLQNKFRRFYVRINNFNLNVGIYYLTFWLGTKNKKYDLLANSTPPLRVLTSKKYKKQTKGYVAFDYEISNNLSVNNKN